MKEKKKPDLSPEVVGINPFTDGLKIYAIKREYKTLNKFGDADVKEAEFEGTPYTKVFEIDNARKQIYDLPIRSQQLYLYLIHAIKSSQDVIWIDKDEYMAKMGINSLNTYKAAISGLCDGAYISKHHNLRDVFWINPHYFFKGSRLSKYPKKVYHKKPKQ